MNVFKRFDGFEFNNDFAFDQKIQPMLANLVITIEEWNCLLTHKRNPAQREFRACS